MRITYVLVILGFVLMGMVFSSNDAYGAAYIKFDGIDGEATDKDHKGWSDLLSLSESSTTNSGSASTNTRGEVVLEDLVVVKELDKSSPKLAESIVMGKVFPTVLINLCSEDSSDCFLSYELVNVMITSYSISGSENQIPVEEISLSFEKLVRNTLSDEQIQTTADHDMGEESEPRVPDWVQTTAQFWIDKNVSDREFTDALGFLVKERIIEVEIEPQLAETDQPATEEPQVPAWIATTTEWWINGEVPEDQFLEGIKWMIKNKIITGI
jgi:type VI secretion system secreted protein Hcp